MTNKDILLVFIGVFIFILCKYEKREMAVLVCIFTIPCGQILQTELIPIGIPGIIVLSIYLFNKLNSKYINSWISISNKVFYLYYFLFIGIIIGLLDLPNLDTYTVASKNFQIYSLSFFIVVLILFIKILNVYSLNLLFQRKIRIVFVSSIFIQSMPFFLQNFGLRTLLLDSIYQTTYDSNSFEEIARFSGFFGDYELIVDYVLIIIAFSLLELINYKKKSFYFLLIILTSLYVGLISGTRSFLIILPLFLFNFYVLNIIYIKKNINFLFFIFLFVFVVVFLMLFDLNSGDFIVFERFQDFLNSYISNGNLSNASNRNFSNLFSVLLESITPFGNGSVFFYEINNDEMVSHNLFFHMYARYGFIGVSLLFYLFYNSFLILLSSIKNNHSDKLRTEGIILAALLVSLFVQELKISGIRYQHSMLIYAYFFMCIYFFAKKSSINRINK